MRSSSRADGYGMAAGLPPRLARRRSDHQSGRSSGSATAVVLGWGGTNTLAQALFHVRSTRPPAASDLRRQAASTRSPTRTTTARGCAACSHPPLHRDAIIAGGESTTSRGTAQRRSLLPQRHGADCTTFTDAWVNANIRGHAARCAYIRPCCIHEGDTPSFLASSTTASAAHEPELRGWGGRYVWRQPSGDRGRSGPRAVIPIPVATARANRARADGQASTSDQATIGAGVTRSSATSRRGWPGRRGAAATQSTRRREASRGPRRSP